MAQSGYKNLDYEKTLALCELIFNKYGFTPEEAACITDVLLRADLYGIESHGIQRLIRYHHAILDGEVDLKAKPEVVFETPVSAVIDGHKSMGQLVSRRAMEMAIAKAKASGIGIVAVRGSNHYGIAGYYSLMAVEQDLIGLCMTNTEAIMVPTFGSKAMLGTNPISVGMPAEPTPYLFDAATTVVPRGKLEVYNKRGDALPTGWAIDKNGNDCNDSGEVLHNIINRLGGGIAPLGGTGELTSGYKGYGFGLVCELFTSIIAGGLTANHCVTEDINTISHSFWAIDYGIFGDKAAVKRSFSAYLDELRNAPKAVGQDRIYVHGEKEFESSVVKKREGIPVNRQTVEEIRMIAGYVGVDCTGVVEGKL